MMLRTLLSQINVDPGELDVPMATPDDNSVQTVVEIAFAIASMVALIVIIIAGIQFMLSRGDPQKAATARNAIIYAAIGLVICMSAYSLVRFVIGSV